MTLSSSQKQLSALIAMIDEPDEKYFLQIAQKIISFGTEAIPMLEIAMENQLQPISQQRLKWIIAKINFDTTCDLLSRWKHETTPQIYPAYINISRCFVSTIDETLISKEINRLRNEIWLEFNAEQTAIEKAIIISNILFKKNNIVELPKGETNIENSFLPSLIYKKSGSIFSLTTLYLLLAEMLHFSLSPVYFPGSDLLLLSYINPDASEAGHAPTFNDCLFYINCGNQGELISKLQIEQFLVKQGDDGFLMGDNVYLLHLLLNNFQQNQKKALDKKIRDDVGKLAQILGNHPIKIKYSESSDHD